MSLPSFPEKDTMPTRDEVINQIISSIAMEELGLSHIINAEGEKLQYALGTIQGMPSQEEPLELDDLLKLNKSIQKTLDSTMMNQYLLKEKLCSALNASVMQGPPGQMGTILDSYKTLEELMEEHPKGAQGDAYLVGGTLYVWDTVNKTWKSVGDLTGPTGPTGPAGPVSTILDSYDTYNDLIADHPKGNVGDLYLVGGKLYAWFADSQDWQEVGDMTGPTGPRGLTGDIGTVLNTYETYNELKTNHPSGSQGDAYIVGEGDLYVWKNNATDWEKVGNIQGPAGAKGDQGDEGPRGPEGPEGPEGPRGVAGVSGVIKGTYINYAALIAAHPTGEEGDMYLVGPNPYELFYWDNINNPPFWHNAGEFIAAQGPKGDQGPTGADSVILDSFEKYEDLIDKHPSGSIGECYLVGGDLYTWIDDSWKRVGNLTGPTGPQGPEASSFTIIPFASQQAPFVGANASGEATTAALLGFGYMEYSTGLGGDAHVAVPLDGSDKSFNLTSAANRQVAFSIPFDMMLNSIYITVGNWGRFSFPTFGSKVFPYVQIYTAAAGTNTFLPLEDAVAKPLIGIDAASADPSTMLEASVDNLKLPLLAGTRIAICGMMEVTGETSIKEYYLYFTGGIGLSRWVRP